ncbi:S-adenosyl-L-methionine-dependent methyltransferase [Syncephalis fuscata]|nr:S-adenosyl-L-methionine-dependent methyltransferase [Syncephalis fuscata]
MGNDISKVSELSQRRRSRRGSSANVGGINSVRIIEQLGRQYLDMDGVAYRLPIDSEEMDRLDSLHYLMRSVTGVNYFAPTEKMTRCIDLGTGSGIWLMEMASEHTNCDFTGVDIILPPTTDLKPANCKFATANILEGLPYPDSSFDFVHHRFLNLAIPDQIWPIYVHECARICAINGWIEMVETTGTLSNVGAHGERFNTWHHQLMHPCGVDLFAVDEVPARMQAARLSDVRTEKYMIPAGDWAGDMGRRGWNCLRANVEAVRHLLIQEIGLSNEEIDGFLMKLNEETNRLKSYWTVKVYCARKLNH